MTKWASTYPLANCQQSQKFCKAKLSHQLSELGRGWDNFFACFFACRNKPRMCPCVTGAYSAQRAQTRAGWWGSGVSSVQSIPRVLPKKSKTGYLFDAGYLFDGGGKEGWDNSGLCL